MKNFSPQGPLVGLLEMPEVHEKVEILLPVVHKQVQGHLWQSQLLLFVLVLAAGWQKNSWVWQSTFSSQDLKIDLHKIIANQNMLIWL